LGIRLLVPSLEHVQVLKAVPADPFSLPRQPIVRLLRWGTDRSAAGIQLVKTFGIVTYQEPRLLFVQDGDYGLRVSLRSDAAVEPGDQVELVGFAEPDGLSAKLVQALVKKVGRTVLPPAPLIDLLDIDSNSSDATRGQIEARLLGRSVKESRQILELRDEKRDMTFSAFFPTSHGSLPPLPVGSRLRLRGVFKAEVDGFDFGQTVTSFNVYGNSGADITILQRQSWWSAQHTFWVTAALAGVLLGCLAWVVLLRKRVQLRTRELRAEIEERKRAHKQLVEVSHQAGMAEVATSVLHNVGNVLNSVNVSSNLVSDRLKHSKAASLPKVVTLLREHEHDLANFFTNDPKGRQLPGYVAQLSEYLIAEQRTVINELHKLTGYIDHIKDIVAMQQNYAKVCGVNEPVRVNDLINDALAMNAGGLTRHDIKLVQQCDDNLPEILFDKHKVLQILINLIRNAKFACDESCKLHKQIIVRARNGDERIKISVTDNGVGISPENLTRIFHHGFTTRKDGHGFGLHSGALAARQMGGSLLVHSDGPDEGATFTLELPVCPKTSPR
jgi:signal transduction histidine kinase